MQVPENQPLGRWGWRTQISAAAGALGVFGQGKGQHWDEMECLVPCWGHVLDQRRGDQDWG